MSWFENNKSFVLWIAGLATTFLGGTGGTYLVKGITAEAKEEVRVEMQTKIDNKDVYTKKLEDEIDVLQLDAVSVGFKYDLCCSTGGSCY